MKVVRERKRERLDNQGYIAYECREWFELKWWSITTDSTYTVHSNDETFNDSQWKNMKQDTLTSYNPNLPSHYSVGEKRQTPQGNFHIPEHLSMNLIWTPWGVLVGSFGEKKRSPPLFFFFFFFSLPPSKPCSVRPSSRLIFVLASPLFVRSNFFFLLLNKRRNEMFWKRPKPLVCVSYSSFFFLSKRKYIRIFPCPKYVVEAATYFLFRKSKNYSNYSLKDANHKPRHVAFLFDPSETEAWRI